MSSFPFVIESAEFKVFSRPNGDIEKLLGTLPKLATSDIVDRMKTSLKIDYEMYNPIIKDKLDRECKEFQHFARQIIPIMKDMQKKIATYMQVKSKGIQNYKEVLKLLEKYEELNLANYVSGNDNEMVFGNTEFKDSNGLPIKESATALSEGLKNPYFNLYHWCKGELFDIEAV